MHRLLKIHFCSTLRTSLPLNWPGLGPHCHGFVSVCTCVFQRCVDWPGLGPHCRGFIFRSTLRTFLPLNWPGLGLHCHGFVSVCPYVLVFFKDMLIGQD